MACLFTSSEVICTYLTRSFSFLYNIVSSSVLWSLGHHSCRKIRINQFMKCEKIHKHGLLAQNRLLSNQHDHIYQIGQKGITLSQSGDSLYIFSDWFYDSYRYFDWQQLIKQNVVNLFNILIWGSIHESAVCTHFQISVIFMHKVVWQLFSKKMTWLHCSLGDFCTEVVKNKAVDLITDVLKCIDYILKLLTLKSSNPFKDFQEP